MEHVIAFKRQVKEKELLIILNYSMKETQLPAGALVGYERVMGNYEGTGSETLHPYEAVILERL